MGLTLREGAVKKQKLLHTQKSLHWQGKEGALNLRREHNKCMGDKVERIWHRDQCRPTLPSQEVVCMPTVAIEGWVLRLRVQGSDPREGTEVDCHEDTLR